MFGQLLSQKAQPRLGKSNSQFRPVGRTFRADSKSTLEALNRSQAMIEFRLDGTILNANDNFLNLMGYTLDEVRGKHHRMFVEPAEQDSAAYREFWEKLRRGEYQMAQYKRIGKGGKEVWIEASYNPIFDLSGKPFKVVKYATDVTRQKQEFADLIGQIKAINRSQAVIEFGLDGTILNANENFLGVMGYTLEEVRGKHHRMFVEPAEQDSAACREFWEKLRRGEYQMAQYKRIGKDGKEVWIEASYNPIFDLSGKPFKVVKYATDLTQRKAERTRLADAFEQGVKVLVDKVSISAKDMQRSAQTIAAAAEQTTQQSAAMAAATTQLSSSANEIARRSVEASGIVGRAVAETNNASSKVEELVGAAGKIGDVTKIINDIAGQTHLLALNATIEAARAGEYGKGFAVVAAEVKALAQQTERATKEIAQQVEGIQISSNAIAGTIKLVSDVISTMNEISLSISSAVEEQSSATSEAAKNIQGVKGAAEDNVRLSTNVLGVAQELAANAEHLQERVDEFLRNVRTM